MPFDENGRLAFLLSKREEDVTGADRRALPVFRIVELKTSRRIFVLREILAAAEQPTKLRRRELRNKHEREHASDDETTGDAAHVFQPPFCEIFNFVRISSTLSFAILRFGSPSRRYT